MLNTNAIAEEACKVEHAMRMLLQQSSNKAPASLCLTQDTSWSTAGSTVWWSNQLYQSWVVFCHVGLLFASAKLFTTALTSLAIGTLHHEV